MIVDITKFIDFTRWLSFLNHSFDKGDEWSKVVTNNGKEDEVKGYLINIPHNLGHLYSKELYAKVVLSDELRSRIERWVIAHESERKGTVHEAARLFGEILNEGEGKTS